MNNILRSSIGLILFVSAISGHAYSGTDSSPKERGGEFSSAAAVEQLFQRGRSYAQKKQYDKAVGAFTDALSYGQFTFEILIARSLSYLELQQYDAALEDASNAIKLRPKNPLGYMMRASIYGRMDRVQDAIDDATRGIEANPTIGEYYATRAAGYLRIGELGKALNDLTAAIALGENDVLVYLDRGLTLKRLGRYEEAIRDYSKALELSPSDYRGLMRRGNLYRCLGQYRKAVSDFTAILVQKPDDLEARLQRAAAYTEAQDFRGALADLTYGVEHGFKDTYMYLNLAYVQYRIGDLGKAFLANEKALALADEFVRPIVYFQNGLLLLIAGQTNDAQKAYDNGRALAEAALNVDGLEDGIQDLREALNLNRAVQDIAINILNQLERMRQKIAPYAKPSQGRCRKLRI